MGWLAPWRLVLTALLLAAGTTLVAADEAATDPPTDIGHSDHSGRLLGIFPNYSATDRTAPSIPTAPLTTTQSFALAARKAFDPSVFLLSGVVAEFGRGANAPGYATRYGTMVADGAIDKFMTTAVLPSLVHDDSRYATSGEGSVSHRIAYALSRTVVTRTWSGATRLNVSDIAGSAAAASLGNFYRGPADRSAAGTLSRFGTQMLWNALGNEVREFWPDIRRKFHKS
jgi:hypothetical protein